MKPDEERKPTAKKAAIGFIYDEGADNKVPLPPEPPPEDDQNVDSEEDSDEEIDLGNILLFVI